MIPVLYYASEKEFLTNGIGRLTDCISCVVTEERNGIYELEFEYPVTGAHFADIKEGRIVVCTHDETGDTQPFDIYKRSATIDGVVTFSARHISYRLSWTVVQPFDASSCAQALNRIPQNTLGDCPFTFWTDKAVTKDFTLGNPEVVRGLLGGQEGSILDVFGTGEYEWDRFTVKLWLHRGEEKPVTIRYGKDLTDLTQDLDFGESYNAVIPFWKAPDDSGTVVVGNQVNGSVALTDSSPWWYDNQRIPLLATNGEELWLNSPQVRTTVMDLSDQYATRPSAATLTARALATLLGNASWLPTESIEIDFVRLYDSPEYADFAPLQSVGLCDTISVLYPAIGLTAKAKIIGVEYNVLLDRYNSMTIGDPETYFADIVKAEAAEEVIKKTASKAFAISVAQEQADLIAGGLGGNVVIGRGEDGHPNEILIMDTDSKQTATYVLRINQNGIAFSTNGYDGPYTTAWTIDGKFSASFIKSGSLNANLIKTGSINANLITSGAINADLITTGSMSANRITAGKLESANGKTFFDLNNSRIETYGNNTDRVTNIVDGSVNFYYNSFLDGKQLVGYIREYSYNLPSVDDDIIIYDDDPNCIGIMANSTVLIGWRRPSGSGYVFSPSMLVGEQITIPSSVKIQFVNPSSSYPDGFFPYIKMSPISGGGFYLRTEGVSCWYQNSADAPVFYYEYGLTIRSIYVVGNVSAGNVINRSDERQKNIKAWDQRYDQLISRLTPILYDWRNSRTDNKTHIGLGAQSVERELKRLGIENSSIVHQEENGEYALNYTELSVLLMKKVQDQQTQIDALTARLEALERRLS